MVAAEVSEARNVASEVNAREMDEGLRACAMANLSFTMLIVCTAAVLALVLGAVGLYVKETP